MDGTPSAFRLRVRQAVTEVAAGSCSALAPPFPVEPLRPSEARRWAERANPARAAGRELAGRRP
ncbi:hypothetical protein ACF9IK_06455 [Kitasatospora hibisci]|uniref:hypothetical protein n=1 Tax=Kitasatospora hibisci TaxID=3369522 RepID=UPI003753F674